MARLNQNRRARIRQAIPPIRCTGRCTDGTPCKKNALVGALVCYTHGGGAPQVRAKAEQRVTLAEAMLTAPKRHPWEVLEDGLHAMDLVMREAVLEIQDRGTVTAELLDKLVSSVERAHRLAKVNLDAGIDQRRLQLAEAQAGQIHKMFGQILAGLNLTAEQRALVPGLVKRVIEGEISPKGIQAA